MAEAFGGKRQLSPRPSFPTYRSRLARGGYNSLLFSLHKTKRRVLLYRGLVRVVRQAWGIVTRGWCRYGLAIMGLPTGAKLSKVAS